MRQIKEKLKAIWHIITDKEYAVFTVTAKNGKMASGCCLVSDVPSKPFIMAIDEFIDIEIANMSYRKKTNRPPMGTSLRDIVRNKRQTS